MVDTDIAFAKQLTDIEKWGHLETDFRRLSGLDPAGCFVAWQDSERLAIVTTASYDRYAFIGNLIVRKDQRAKGIGYMLMEHAVSYLDHSGVRTIELDGVFAALSIYRRLGFVDKYLSMRFARAATAQIVADTDERIRCPDLPESILNFDREKTGIERGRLLRLLIEEHSDTTYFLGREKIVAYGVVRNRENGVLHIGPVVAEDDLAFEELLSSIISRHGKDVLTMGVLKMNRATSSILLKYNFEYRPPSLRMYRGQRLDYERHVYGIVSADVG
jgi:GNAT superfamily N-acetyltransferase